MAFSRRRRSRGRRRSFTRSRGRRPMRSRRRGVRAIRIGHRM